ncbi:EAL domain-containing protein [Virgibacillus byunsanensis]|uniref:EAL domain-containing protein n=1 Tax=Virgibacillus byunsanensis TaxID=570945 RepID=A0ABW3LNA8_9BACI
MQYTWRFICTSILLVSNLISLSYVDSDTITTIHITSFILNLLIGWIVGTQIDKYLYSKKELGTANNALANYSYALDSAADAICIINEKGEIEFANDALTKLYGYNHKEILSLNWGNLLSKESTVHLLKPMISDVKEHGQSREEVIGVRHDGETFTQEITLSQIKENNKMICVCRDITKQKQYEEYMTYISEQNELTKMPNRRRLHKDLEGFKQKLNDLSILFIDLDRFKITNDTLGHDIGDELLKSVAKNLSFFKNDDINVYHLGGDEFIVLIGTSDNEYIHSIVNSISESLHKPFYINGNEITITSSIGVSIFPTHTDNMDKLLNFADTAMYYAKLDGKNTYKFFNDDLRLQLNRRAIIETELRKSIRNEELFICYQPKCALRNQNLVGLEALIRWKNPRLGTVSPMEFIPIAEDIGLINDIGNWVIKEVLTMMNIWQKSGYPLVKVSVNVSQKQFRDGMLVSYIESCLNTFNIDAQYLEVEITESVIEDFELVTPQLNRLKEIGVGIAIDDFGTGYSSLSLIKNLPIDTIKIDQSFLRDSLNEKDISIVEAILKIGHTLNLDIVAEGVETEEHLHILVQLNCPYGQGYFFSKPLVTSELEDKFLNLSYT